MEEFLETIREKATVPWVYPMVAFAAYTGAKRSEILRALLTDVDLVAGVVTIREKKRQRCERGGGSRPQVAGEG